MPMDTIRWVNLLWSNERFKVYLINIVNQNLAVIAKIAPAIDYSGQLAEYWDHQQLTLRQDFHIVKLLSPHPHIPRAIELRAGWPPGKDTAFYTYPNAGSVGSVLNWADHETGGGIPELFFWYLYKTMLSTLKHAHSKGIAHQNAHLANWQLVFPEGPQPAGRNYPKVMLANWEWAQFTFDPYVQLRDVSKVAIELDKFNPRYHDDRGPNWSDDLERKINRGIHGGIAAATLYDEVKPLADDCYNSLGYEVLPNWMRRYFADVPRRHAGVSQLTTS